jgi:putative aldouronate transport system permease protein
LVLSTLGVLRIFDQILAMKNAAIERSVDVIMMYTYEKGILKFDMGVANAAGILILLATLILTLAIRKATRYDEG